MLNFLLKISCIYKSLRRHMNLFNTIFYFDKINHATHFAHVISELLDSALSVSWIENKKHSWNVEVLSSQPIKIDFCRPYMEHAKKYEVKVVQDQDWLTLSYASFNPFVVSNFRIFGSHRKYDQFVKDKINLEINAATAFGSGEHYTTSGCLKAIGQLLNHHKHKICMDLGTGSGILAIAMAKLGAKKVYAFDNDAQAVVVANENAKINGVSKYIRAAQNLAGEFDKKNYDFIVANILENPLIDLSKSICKCLNYNGILILSGYVKYENVEKAYVENGLNLKFRTKSDGWYVSVFRKGSLEVRGN